MNSKSIDLEKKPRSIQSTVNIGDIQIEVRDVVRTFEMGETTVHALNEVSIQVKKGEFLVILGPSGSGSDTVHSK